MNKDLSEKICHSHIDSSRQETIRQEVKRIMFEMLAELINEKENSLKQIDEYMTLITKDRENQLDLIIKVLNSLTNELGLIKAQYLQTFEFIIVSIRKLIEQLQTENQSFIKKIESINTIDIHRFYEQANEEYMSNSQCFDNSKKDIQFKLLALTETQNIQQCIDVLSNFNNIKTFFDDQFLNQDQEEMNYVALGIICDEHKEQVVLLDLNKDRALLKQIACLLCADSYCSQYKSIKYVQQEWKQIEEIRKENMNKNTSLLKSKVEKFHEISNKIKNDSQIIIEKAQKQINTNLNEFLQEYQEQEKHIEI